MVERLVRNAEPFAIYAVDDPDPNAGGACHVYDVREIATGKVVGTVRFQHGPIREAGVNGVPDIALGLILQDRMRSFQQGQFANVYNDWGQSALASYVASQDSRTRDRLRRGVEGFNLT